MCLRIGKQRGKTRTGIERSSLHQTVFALTGHFIHIRILFIHSGLIRTYQRNGIGRTIRQVRGITQEHVAHRAHVVLAVTGGESGVDGRGRGFRFRVFPFRCMGQGDLRSARLFQLIDGSHSHSGKGNQVITHVRHQGFFTVYRRRSRETGSFGKGRTLFQVRI